MAMDLLDSAKSKGGKAQASAKPFAAPISRGPWWAHALILEIYPRSYGDSNSDGVINFADFLNFQNEFGKTV